MNETSPSPTRSRASTLPQGEGGRKIAMVYLRPRADAEAKIEAAVTFEDGSTTYVPLTKGMRAEMLKVIALAIAEERTL